MSDDKKINEEDWEKIFQEQVAGYFKRKGLEESELEAAVAAKIDQVQNGHFKCHFLAFWHFHF